MKKLFKILFIFSILFFNGNVFASNLFITSDINKVSNGAVFTAVLNLDTDSESINALEGDLIYDKDIFKIEKINIGNSFINFWVEKPDIKIPGIVHFSGITPGGVVINKGEVFQIIFRTLKEGSSNLSLKNVNLFINDGEGTPSKVKISNININILKNVDGISSPLILDDSIMPEKFNFSRIKDESIFDNKYFIVFSASDKETGIDYYTVCEYWSCIESNSPHLLKYQNIFYHIVVRAYDGNGNIREARMTSPHLTLLVFVLFILIFFYCRYFYLHKV